MRSSFKREILTIRGTVQGISMKCGIDCGATSSIMSFETANKYNFKIFPSFCKVKLASSKLEYVKGITDCLLIDVKGHLAKLKFIVIDHNDHDILLGLNWFEITKAGVYPAIKMLKFPDQDIYLPDNETDKSGGTIDSYDDILVSVFREVDGNEIDVEDEWTFAKTTTLTPQEKLNKRDLDSFNELLKEFKNMFANDIATLGACSVREHRIMTQDAFPIYLPPYRKSEKERQEIKKEIDLMLRANIIRKSKSPWSSPVILIPKANGTMRMCIDYRKLNKVTIQQNWPIPRIQDILDRLSGSVWFSALDLKSGYWQIKMHQDSIEKTAFSTPDGHYEFLRLPFGLKNAPSDFSRIMSMILSEFKFVEIYLDDITVHSKSVEEHICHLRQVFDTLSGVKLRLNPEKCVFFAKKIKILGHVVSQNQVGMDPTKIEALKNRMAPKNVKELQTFLGICSYYRRFVKNFSNISVQLWNLLKVDTKFVWSEDCQAAFKTLIDRLTSEPVLRLPDFEKPFIIYTDASGYALGCILAQYSDEGNEHVIAYGSRLLKGAEVHYGITEKECLAVIYGVKQFRVYVYGTKFKIITDHAALAWLMNITDPTGRVARWAIYLQAFDFEIVHRKGLVHSNVDTLSRPVLANNITVEVENQDISTKYLDIFEHEALLNFVEKGKHLPGISKKSAKRVETQADHYKMDRH